MKSTVYQGIVTFKFMPHTTAMSLVYLKSASSRLKVALSETALRFIAETSRGNLRYATNLLEQVSQTEKRDVRGVKEAAAALTLF